MIVNASTGMYSLDNLNLDTFLMQKVLPFCNLV